MKFLHCILCCAIPSFYATSHVPIGPDDEEVAEISSSEISAARAVSNTPTAFPRQVVPGIHVVGTSDRGRVVEWYNETLVSEFINWDVVERLEKQIKADRQFDLFTPNLHMADPDGNPPALTEYTPLGEISLGRRIYKGIESGIYEIQGMEEYLIKYQANCDEVRDGISLREPVLHPLLPDYWYSKRAAPISASVVFLSPPAFLCKEKIGKCDFGLSDEEYTQCSENFGTVRFMIMKKEAGNDLQTLRGHYPRGIVPFGNVMGLATHLILILEQLHTKAKIVHGDIHAGNVLIVNPKPGVTIMKLVDFGRAFRIVQRPNRQRYPARKFRHFLYSHWQSQGLEWGPRDDLMRALQLVAQIMNPWSYMDYESALQERGQAVLLAFKNSSFIFVQPEFLSDQRPFDPIQRLRIEPEAKNFIRKQLSGILDQIRALSDVNALPNYKDIIDKFEICRKLADEEIVMTQLSPIPTDPQVLVNVNTTTSTTYS